MKKITLYIDSTHWYAIDANGKWISGCRGSTPDCPLEGVSAWLEGLAHRRHSIAIILSVACVPYLSLPWNVSNPAASELRRSVHEAWHVRGVSRDSHDIRIHWPNYGMPVMTLAYPLALLQGLIAQLGRHKLSSLECSIFALAGRRLKGGGAARELLLLSECDGYSALHVDAGQVVDIEYLKPDGIGLDAVPVWLRRKALEYSDSNAMGWLTGECPDINRLCETLA